MSVTSVKLTKETTSTKSSPTTATTVPYVYARYALAGGLCCQATHTILVPVRDL
jgi:hypothetical protein